MLARGAESSLNRSLQALAALIDRLPRVSKWLNALRNLSVLLQKENGLDAAGKSLLRLESRLDVPATCTASVTFHAPQGKERVALGRGAGKTRCALELWKRNLVCRVGGRERGQVD